jgi:DNA-binding NtrC family response regulator
MAPILVRLGVTLPPYTAGVETESIDEEPGGSPADRAGAHPGVLVVFSGGRPECRVLAFPAAHDAIEIGRDELAAAGVPDAKVSARHVRVAREDGLWSVRDLDSRNGTFVDGRQVQAGRQLSAPVLRVGRTILLPVHDRRPLATRGVEVAGGVVTGPLLRAAHERAAVIARSGATLLVLGESGSGKELCAAAFHAGGGDAGRPLVAVNCATIPRELAERTLFGARRGAYTGAVADSEGLVQAAHGGTLFLDEIAELDLGVQAKLLRVLETRQVTPMGGVKPVAVDVRVVAATHKSLRAEVVAGRFREDLYFRIGRPELRLPPLRERREEIPFLIDRALRALPGGATITASAELVEACLLRPWPGNVRELLAEARTAAVAAAAAGRELVAAGDLDEDAGEALDGGGAEEAAPDEPAGGPLPEPAAIEAALRAEQGNVARAAARLGLSRSRLRRFIARAGIDLQALRG